LKSLRKFHVFPNHPKIKKFSSRWPVQLRAAVPKTATGSMPDPREKIFALGPRWNLDIAASDPTSQVALLFLVFLPALVRPCSFFGWRITCKISQGL
jgi:hypothetical protein